MASSSRHYGLEIHGAFSALNTDLQEFLNSENRNCLAVQLNILEMCLEKFVTNIDYKFFKSLSHSFQYRHNKQVILDALVMTEKSVDTCDITYVHLLEVTRESLEDLKRSIDHMEISFNILVRVASYTINLFSKGFYARIIYKFGDWKKIVSGLLHEPLECRLRKLEHMTGLLKSCPENICGICLVQELTVELDFAVLDCCRHIFCTACISPWFERQM